MFDSKNETGGTLVKPILSLFWGFNDAENYKQRKNRELFNSIFVKNDYLDDLICSDKFFLIGEKGTGKTAYAVFLEINNYQNTRACLKFIRETDYSKFLSMKQEKHLQLSDYSSIWQVILLLLIANEIREEDLETSFFSKRGRLDSLKNAVNEYYVHAFTPEIVNTFSLVENSKIAAELFNKFLKASGEESRTQSFSESNFQVNLLYLERQFKEALAEIKLKQNRILFIDGIDIRPGSIPYSEYLDCIKGLANAIWTLNSSFFSQINDSKGRMRVVLLLRPDIFSSLSLQNSTNKLLDNSVFLDWRTTYPEYRTSKLFEVTDNMLRVQQEVKLDAGKAWDYYFPWESTSKKLNGDFDDSFVDFLRYSYSRPRDIVTIMNILHKTFKAKNRTDGHFKRSDFFNNEFLNAYSQYLMGSVKDQLSFYYTDEEYETFLAFFNFLNGQPRFSFQEYRSAYQKFAEYVLEKRNSIPEFVETDEKFLQFLYDTNVISYVEQAEFQNFVRWCYRERSLSNINPKVKMGLNYQVHRGLWKELNLGNQEMKETI